MQCNKKKRLLTQVRQFRARFAQSVDAVLGDALTRSSLVRWVAEESGTYRERIYSPFATLVLFIEQVLGSDHSCQDAVARGLSARVAQDQSPVSLNTGSYCRARARLSLTLPTRLAREVGHQTLTTQPSAWRWRGREVKLIDGTTMSMPDTLANQACFPQNRQQQPGLGFPLARLVAIVSLSCGAVLEWAVAACEGKNTGETALLWRLMSSLSQRDVVIADSYYCGYFLVAGLIARGVDIVMPQHHLRLTDFRRGRQLGTRDHLVAWARPQCPTWMEASTYATMPDTLTMREVRVGGRTLVTTLTDANTVSKPELATLYGNRWHIELDLRAIKTVMQMDILRCKTPVMVEKEIAVHLLAYNLVRGVMAQAAFAGNRLPRQLSFKAALQLLNAFEMQLRHCPRQRLTACHAHIIHGIARCRLRHRSERVEPRVVKRRPKQHWLLTKPRHVLQAQLRRRQQRRKRWA